MARTVGSVAEHTRQQILDAARDLFVERGYAGTSVRDIVSTLGITKGSLYYHFASKEELLSALVTPFVDGMRDFVTDARQAGMVDAAMLHRLVDLLVEHAPMMRSAMGDPSTMRELMRRYRLPDRLLELQRVLAGSDSPIDLLRAQCAFGALSAPIMRPGPPPGYDSATPVPPMTAEQRGIVVAAALAVLQCGMGPPREPAARGCAPAGPGVPAWAAEESADPGCAPAGPAGPGVPA